VNSSSVPQQINEVTCISYSPIGDVIAVGSRDRLIHILSVTNGYKRIAVCKGHGSYVTNIDFSTSGLFMQSNDAVREILFWDVTTGKSISQSSKCREIVWSTWTCVYGWPCQGVHNGASGSIEDGDINAVVRPKRQPIPGISFLFFSPRTWNNLTGNCNPGKMSRRFSYGLWWKQYN
jgi:WD40 repeat protein